MFEKFIFLSILLLTLMNVIAEEKLSTITKTVNDTGWTFNDVYDSVSKAYVEFSAKDNNSTLELGAGRGATAASLTQQRLLHKNNAEIVVNDIAEKHLKEALVEYPILNNKNVKMLPGIFPDQINFQNETFNSILASRLFHLLTPDQWRTGLNKIYAWLKPGGHFYITTGSYYIANQKDNIKNIEQKKRNGEAWPATFKTGQDAYGENYKSGPATLVDQDILIRELKLAGFEILQEEYIDGRKLLPANFCLDGREGVAAIARKPLN